MYYFVISITDNKGKRYVESFNPNRLPIDTENRKKAMRFRKSLDAHRYVNRINMILSDRYKQNGVSDEERYFYQVQSTYDDKYQFYITITVESEENENEIILEVNNQPYFGSMDDTTDECVRIMKSVNGVLRECVIRSLKEGIATIGFVDEYRFEPFNNTQSY